MIANSDDERAAGVARIGIYQLFLADRLYADIVLVDLDGALTNPFNQREIVR